MKIFSKINSLIERYKHPNTPIEEARTCAHLVVRMIIEHDLRIVPKEEMQTEEQEISTVEETEEWWNQPDSELKEVTLFKTLISKSKGICVACGKQYNVGVIVAFQIGGSGITHYACREHWMKGH